MSFFFQESKDHLNLIVDIQSSVVRGALIWVQPGEKPHIVWTSSIDIPHRPHGGGSYLINTAVKAVETISNDVHTFIRDTHAHPELPDKITQVHCVLSSPWIVSHARTINQTFENDMRISRFHISNIIKAERLSMITDSDDHMIGIEEKIFDVRLNGYSIQKWEGVSARSLEISFAISMAGKQIVTRITHACKMSGVHESRIHFHSSLLLQHIGLSTALQFKGLYILAHVHGELTDIVVASGQTCILFGSYPVGVRTIIRTLATKLKVDESSADSALSLYEDTTLDLLHGAHDANKIQTVLADWVNNCHKITSLVPDQYQPTHAIISSRYHETAFKNIFKASYPTIMIDPLSVEDLYDLATFDAGVERLRHTVLYLIAIHSLESL